MFPSLEEKGLFSKRRMKAGNPKMDRLNLAKYT